MEIVLPKFGLFFWTLIIFLIYYFLIAKFAWKPILASIKQREESIEKSLKDAETARQEIQKMNELAEKLHKEALAEKDKLLKETEELITQQKQKAEKDVQALKAQKIVEIEKEVQNIKNAAIVEMKNMVGKLSVEIAQKILREQLKNPQEQEQFAQSELNKMNLN